MSKPERIELPNGWCMRPRSAGEWYDILDKVGTRVPTELSEYGALLFAESMNAPSTRLAEAEKVIKELVDGYNHQRDCDIENIGKPEHLHVSSTKLQRALTRAREYQGKKD